MHIKKYEYVLINNKNKAINTLTNNKTDYSYI